jgi:hypothetical protein
MVLLVFSIVPVATAQTLLQITSPTQGPPFLLFTEDQTYTITVSADPSVQNIGVLAQASLPEVQPTSSSTQFTLTLPTNIPPGLYQIGAVGFNSSGDVESAPVLIEPAKPIVRKAFPAESPSCSIIETGSGCLLKYTAAMSVHHPTVVRGCVLEPKCGIVHRSVEERV